MPDDFVNIEAAKEGGIPWYSGDLESAPVWRRETLIAKVVAEREAENYLYEKARRDRERNSNRR